MRIVLVDLDGTLLDKPSTERRFIRYLVREGMIGLRQWLAAGQFFVRWTLRFGRDVGRKNKAYLAGLDRERVALAGERFVASEILPRLHPPMLLRLSHHTAAGDALVLLTGAPDFIAIPVARHIRARRLCATQCELRDGRYATSPPPHHPLGWAKLDLALGLAKEWNSDLGECIAYADSGDDIPLLRAVGRPIAVNPDRRLTREADRRGWEILRFGNGASWGDRCQPSLPD